MVEAHESDGASERREAGIDRRRFLQLAGVAAIAPTGARLLSTQPAYGSARADSAAAAAPAELPAVGEADWQALDAQVRSWWDGDLVTMQEPDLRLHTNGQFEPFPYVPAGGSPGAFPFLFAALAAQRRRGPGPLRLPRPRARDRPPLRRPAGRDPQGPGRRLHVGEIRCRQRRPRRLTVPRLVRRGRRRPGPTRVHGMTDRDRPELGTILDLVRQTPRAAGWVQLSCPDAIEQGFEYEA